MEKSKTSRAATRWRRHTAQRAPAQSIQIRNGLIENAMQETIGKLRHDNVKFSGKSWGQRKEGASMLIYDSCQSAIQSCLDTKTFAIARLYNAEKTMGIHIHDCYEVYFSISGGEQFLIDSRVYEFQPGDIFFINQFESHYLSRVNQASLERVVLCIHPDYVTKFSTPQTNLNSCFTYRNPGFSHRIRLSEQDRKRFMYFIHKLSEDKQFGQDVLDQAVFLEMMTFLNHTFMSHCTQPLDSIQTVTTKASHAHIDEILSYINQHLSEKISISMLATHFHFSNDYLSRIFKETTGTTINRYITAKRISRAKALLAEGHSVMETSALCGFGDYSNFLRAFSKVVGMSPQKYAAYVRN